MIDYADLYVKLIEAITPFIQVCGLVALTVALVVMLINMLIDAFTGKGLHIGCR